MKEAMERYGVSSGSLNSALTYGYSAGGYHFYRADEPKPDDSFFKSGNGGKGSSKKRPVICLETGVQFESAIAALKWLDSGKTNNRGNMRTALIAVLADVDEDGFPLIAALRPGGNAVSEGRSVGGTIVCSFYGKPENYFRFKMQQMPQRVLYQDIEKGRELDARAKLQLFGGNIASPDLDRRIIRPPECIVKLRADTPQMETHGRETSRVRRESRDMASGRAALDAGRRAETARVTERHIDSNLK